MRVRLACWMLLVGMWLGGCRGSYLEEVHEAEMQRLRRFMASQGVDPWEYRGVLFGVKVPGDSLRIAEGDTLRFRYTIYALGGTARVLESNDTVVANRQGLARVQGRDTVCVYIVGRTRTVEGLDLALRHLARGRSQVWVGVPSALGYGGRQVGAVKPHTPLCYELQIGRASSEVVK